MGVGGGAETGNGCYSDRPKRGDRDIPPHAASLGRAPREINRPQKTTSHIHICEGQQRPLVDNLYLQPSEAKDWLLNALETQVLDGEEVPRLGMSADRAT